MNFFFVVAALVVVQTGFGGYGVLVAKFARHVHTNAVVFSFIRDGCCFPVLMIVARLLEGPLMFPKSWGELSLFAFLGLTGMFGGQLAYILGIYYANANIASIYQPAMPVWTAVFVIIAGVEPFPPLTKLFGILKVAGIAFAAGGAVMMAISKGSGSGMQNELLGNICSVLNTLFFAIYMTAQKKYVYMGKGDIAERWKKYPAHITAWSYFFGAAFMIIGALIAKACHLSFFGFGYGGSCKVPSDCSDDNLWDCTDDGVCSMYTNSYHIPTPSIGPLVYAIFVTSALCYGLITFANKHASTSTVTAFWPLQVFVTTLLSYFVFGDVITPLQGGGAAMIICGLASIITSNVLEEREKAADQGDLEKQPLVIQDD